MLLSMPRRGAPLTPQALPQRDEEWVARMASQASGNLYLEFPRIIRVVIANQLGKPVGVHNQCFKVVVERIDSVLWSGKLVEQLLFLIFGTNACFEVRVVLLDTNHNRAGLGQLELVQIAVVHYVGISKNVKLFCVILLDNTGATLMTTVDDVIAVAGQLSPAEQREIIQALSRVLQQQYAHGTTASASPTATQRIGGLDKGTFWMSDDFNDELPDEFWFGDRNESAA